jgi:hypothetical protein
MSNTQDRLQQAKRYLEEQLKAQELWENEVYSRPGKLEPINQLEVIKQRVAQARITVERAEEAAALAADPDNPKTKAELKQLDQINKDGAKLMDDITKAAIALDGQIQELLTLQKQADKLAMRYDKRPWYSGITMARIQSMGHAITRWRQEVRSWDAHKRTGRP